MSKPFFLEKIRKILSVCHLLNYTESDKGKLVLGALSLTLPSGMPSSTNVSVLMGNNDSFVNIKHFKVLGCELDIISLRSQNAY